jgi:hypothetical protein
MAAAPLAILAARLSVGSMLMETGAGEVSGEISGEALGETQPMAKGGTPAAGEAASEAQAASPNAKSVAPASESNGPGSAQPPSSPPGLTPFEAAEAELTAAQEKYQQAEKEFEPVLKEHLEKVKAAKQQGKRMDEFSDEFDELFDKKADAAAELKDAVAKYEAMGGRFGPGMKPIGRDAPFQEVGPHAAEYGIEPTPPADPNLGATAHAGPGYSPGGQKANPLAPTINKAALDQTAPGGPPLDAPPPGPAFDQTVPAVPHNTVPAGGPVYAPVRGGPAPKPAPNPTTSAADAKMTAGFGSLMGINH